MFNIYGCVCVSGSGGKEIPWPKVPASTVSPMDVSLMDAPRAHRTNEQPLRESDTAARDQSQADQPRAFW
jgi:hypothetical protein